MAKVTLSFEKTETEEASEMSVQDIGITEFSTAEDIVGLFYRVMLAAGYHPTTIKKYINIEE